MDGKVAVALDRNMKSQILVQIKKAPEFSDPCALIGGCGALKCPAGFVETEEPGHCCPYCVNPAITIDTIVTGPKGIAGGKPSFMCPNVWCFPTMCITGMGPCQMRATGSVAQNARSEWSVSNLL